MKLPRPGMRARGQALPLALAGVVFLTLMTLLVFNTGQVTAQKMRLANTADAAVYSAMVWEARTLNYEAYLNRAMVANQVSIAQVVSLISWSRYANVLAQEVSFLMSFVPFLQPLAAGISNGSTNIRDGVATFGTSTVRTLDAVIKALQVAQQPVKIAGGVAATAALADVIEKNDPHFRPTLLAAQWAHANAQSFSDFTKQYSDSQAQERQAKVITDARDKFTAQRSWSLGNWWVMAGMPIQFRVEKTGETRLMSDADKEDDEESLPKNREWQWKAKDTLSLHGKYYSCSWSSGCGWRYMEIPISWGAANYSTTGDDLEYCEDYGGAWRFATECPAWSRNASAEKIADGTMKQISVLYRGLQPYMDLTDVSAQNKDPRLYLNLELVSDRAHLRTSAQVDGLGSEYNQPVTSTGMGEGMFYLDDRLASEGSGEVLSVVSSAEVYFKRPVPRVAGVFGATDSREEYGSLFNPYWDVRLRQDDAARQEAWTRRVSNLFSGGGSI